MAMIKSLCCPTDWGDRLWYTAKDLGLSHVFSGPVSTQADLGETAIEGKISSQPEVAKPPV